MTTAACGSRHCNPLSSSAVPRRRSERERPRHPASEAWAAARTGRGAARAAPRPTDGDRLRAEEQVLRHASRVEDEVARRLELTPQAAQVDVEQLPLPL